MHVKCCKKIGEDNTLAKRSEIDNQYKWDAEAIIRESDWDKVYQEVLKKADVLQNFKGKLGTVDGFYEFSKKDEETESDLERLYVYAMMRRDEDGSVGKYTAMCGRADSLLAVYSQKTAFVTPELTALPEKTLAAFAKEPKLKDYDYYIKQIIRKKKHILSEKEEALLAGAGEVLGGYQDVFMTLDNVNLNLGSIMVDGKEEQLSHAKYSALLQNPDRSVRKAAYEKFYEAYKKLIHTIATTYNMSVKTDWLYAKARHYDSCLQAAMSSEDADPQVYENLLKAVNANIETLHSYIEFKKQALGVDEFHMYDMYVPIIEGADLKLDYEEAFSLVKEGLKVLGDDYQQLLTQAHDNGWIDVYENEGKRSGAYSISERTSHPFVLLNHEKTTHAVFTIAHELGHAMHSYYSKKNQPLAKQNYVIFVAEVASTVNEVLLLRHIVSKTTDKKLKKYLLQYLLEMLRTTLFRQTQFAEFEYESHAMIERGEPLTCENLSEKYLALNKKYYGAAVADDDCIKYEWARIPHFYRAFYVYKYATGIISAVSIADGLLSGDSSKLDAYKKFLASGGSDSPVELLKIAGIDLTTQAPYERAMKVFQETLEELKKS